MDFLSSDDSTNTKVVFYSDDKDSIVAYNDLDLEPVDFWELEAEWTGNRNETPRGKPRIQLT